MLEWIRREIMCTHEQRRPPTTLWIVEKDDDGSGKCSVSSARAAKTRLIKWKRFTVIQWHTKTKIIKK